MSLPSSISPCPIIEVVFDIRFKTEMPEEAVAGMLYQALISETPTMEPLPLADVPATVRNSDPDLIYKPVHRLIGDRFIGAVGPRVMAFSCALAYPGWQHYRESMLQLTALVSKSPLKLEVERFGLRYVSFFPGDIFSSLKVSFTLAGNECHGSETFFKTIVGHGDIRSLLHIGNGLRLTKVADHLPYKKGDVGTIIDIDTFFDFPLESSTLTDAAERFLTAAHDFEKQLFFSLLKDDFLDSLSPKYEPETK